jgi:hypothetical protein
VARPPPALPPAAGPGLTACGGARSGYKGIVVVDEAYIDFALPDANRSPLPLPSPARRSGAETGACGSASCASLVAEFPNLVVLQTMSKGFGLAVRALLPPVAPPFAPPCLLGEGGVGLGKRRSGVGGSHPPGRGLTAWARRASAAALRSRRRSWWR